MAHRMLRLWPIASFGSRRKRPDREDFHVHTAEAALRRCQNLLDTVGAMARIGTVGDRLIVMAFAYLQPSEMKAHRPRVVALDASNQIVARFEYATGGEEEFAHSC